MRRTKCIIPLIGKKARRLARCTRLVIFLFGTLLIVCECRERSLLPPPEIERFRFAVQQDVRRENRFFFSSRVFLTACHLREWLFSGVSVLREIASVIAIFEFIDSQRAKKLHVRRITVIFKFCELESTNFVFDFEILETWENSHFGGRIYFRGTTLIPEEGELWKFVLLC